MKTKIWKQTMTAALAVLLLVGTLPVGAAEIGTQELITNGGFTLTDGVPEGWGIVYGSGVEWEQIVKTETEDSKDGYIDLSFAHSKAYGVEQVAVSNPGDNWLLTFDYKAQGDVSFQIQGNYGSTSLPEGVKDSTAFPTPFKTTMAATTGEGYTRATVLLPSVTETYEGIDYKADRVGIYLRNIAKKSEIAEDTVLLIDNVSVHTYKDDALVKNGDFTLGATSWKSSIGDSSGTVSFENGELKITGTATAGKNYASTTAVLNEELLPDGITHMRYRLSFKYKAYNEETEVAATIGSAQVGMSYNYDKAVDSDINTTYLLRNPSPTYTRALEGDRAGWTECVYYTRNFKASKASNNSYATTPDTATAFGVQLKSMGAGITILYDDVEVTPLPYVVQKVTDGVPSEAASIAAGDSIIVSGVAANRTASEITPAMYIAFYSEGTSGKKLVSMQSVNTVNLMMATTNEGTTTYAPQDSATLPANRSGIITSSEITVPAAKAGETLSMKVYVWSGSGLVPLGDAYTLSGAVSAS